MLPFSESSPFPFLTSSHTHAEAQAHSARVDAWLGLQTGAVEKRLAEIGCRKRAPNSSGEKQELWFGLDVQTLLTPYAEIRSLLEGLDLKAGQTVVDMGAGYGRMGFVIGRHYPGVRFVGYEYVGERVEEGRRCLSRFPYPLVSLEHADLAAPGFKPVEADHYFIYDFGTPRAIEKALHDLRRIAERRPLQIIGRGRHCRYIIDRSHPWLERADMNAPEGRVTVYRSRQDRSVFDGIVGEVEPSV